jgi:uncharacterized repeat protein (TIGR04052 family)
MKAAPLALLSFAALAACSSPAEQPIEIAFAATVGAQPFSCQPSAGGFGGEELRLYLHDFELVAANGQRAALRLADDGVWQDGVVAMLDFEDGSGSCRDGTEATRTKVVGSAPAGAWTGLRFRIGVPFSLNHADPAVAYPPVNLGRMNWGWRAGYKFIRFEGREAEGRRVSLHLGSTGCEGTIGDIEKCSRPNRARVELAGFDPAASVVTFDLGLLVEAMTRDGGDGACMSEPDDPDCVALFPLFGLDGAGEPSTSPGFVWLASAAPQG